MKKRNLVVANWKMTPETPDEAKKIFNTTRLAAKSLKSTDVVICAPFPFLQMLSKLDKPKNLFLGVQNVSSEIKGAFTGEVSAAMVKNMGAGFAIIGHSERRAMGESNEMIGKKIQRAFDSKITPILCIGEKERSREGTHLEFIKTQIKECLGGLQKKNLVGLIIAYEPVWAIGKSYKDAMTPTDVHEMTLFIKKAAGEIFGKDIADSFRILYGAAVEPENAPLLFSQGNIAGLLVGHASLDLDQFPKILKAADMKK
jgi:triosephosphate isomerase (TIM)